MQLLDKAVCISLCANTIVKGMNLSFLPPVGKELDRLSSLAWVRQLVKSEGVGKYIWE